MKIGFLTQNEAPFRMKWVDEMAKYEEVVVFHVDEYDKSLNKSYISYKPKRAKSINVSKRVLGMQIYDLKSVFKEKCDVYILDGYGFKAQQLVIPLLNAKGIDFIMSIDGGFIKKDRNIFVKKVKQYCIQSAKYFFSTSEDTDDYIRHYLHGKERVFFRHYFSSITSDDIRQEGDFGRKEQYRRQLDLNNDFTIVAVGRLIRVKGFDVLLNAAKEISGDFQIVIIGEGEEKDKLIELSDSIKERVRFVDFCNKDLLNQFYRASDVFILLSRGDTWGLVVGEAMSQGLPVITTNRCLAGNAMIKNGINGYIVPTEDIDQVARRIEHLMHDKRICLEMAYNNLKDIQKYCIDNAVKVDIENIRKIINERY